MARTPAGERRRRPASLAGLVAVARACSPGHGEVAHRRQRGGTGDSAAATLHPGALGWPPLRSLLRRAGTEAAGYFGLVGVAAGLIAGRAGALLLGRQRLAARLPRRDRARATHGLCGLATGAESDLHRPLAAGAVFDPNREAPARALRAAVRPAPITFVGVRAMRPAAQFALEAVENRGKTSRELAAAHRPGGVLTCSSTQRLPIRWCGQGGRHGRPQVDVASTRAPKFTSMPMPVTGRLAPARSIRWNTAITPMGVEHGEVELLAGLAVLALREFGAERGGLSRTAEESRAGRGGSMHTRTR